MNENNQGLDVLDDIKISAIGKKASSVQNGDDIILSGINLVESQDVNTMKKLLGQK